MASHRKDTDDASIGYLKAFAFFGLIMLFGMFKGCTDARYMIQGASAEGVYQEVKPVKSRRGSVTGQQVKFTFTDKEGKQMVGYDRVSTSWQPPMDGALDIAYLPGKVEKHSEAAVARLAENGGKTAAIMLIIGGLGAALSGFLLWRAMETAPGA